ncbi:(2Fe-2S)-binding protein [Streptomyces sp. NPDC094437]|uniref:(2Fe-2S)-binding protein n=1 Tax=Streptomyces sp. NPDC094437 TaxID=3366060 RepID=UPI0038218AE0
MTLALETPPTSVERLLAASYRRVSEVCPALDAVVPDPGAPRAGDGDGVRGDELAQQPYVLDAFVTAEADRIRDRHGVVARRDAAATRALHDYAWSVSLLMSGVWYLEARVPRVRPEDIRLDLASGTFRIAPGSEFACLADDPAAALPGAVPLPHPEALRGELRSAVADHMGPLLAALAPSTRRGPRALWGLVADDLVSGIWYLGRMLGQEEAAIRAATAVLPSARGPFPGGADFRRLTGADGRRHPTRTRRGCCLFYTVRPAEACVTCPRTSDAERLRRLEA